jgi:hypothetical protein
MEPALAETLAFAVPLWVAELRGVPAWRRRLIARQAAAVVAAQGDTLMFGSKAKFGQGAKEMAEHKGHARRVAAGDKGEFIRACPVCARGQASYSAGEVFNELAKGLACAAYQPGGVTFGALSWCAGHPRERWAQGMSCPACLCEEIPAKRRAAA